MGDVGIKANGLDEIEMEREGRATLFFVPIKPGKYRVYAKGLDGEGALHRGKPCCPSEPDRLGTALKVLHGAFVLLGSGARWKRAEVAAPPGFWVNLARIKPVLARFQFADHGKPHQA